MGIYYLQGQSVLRLQLLKASSEGSKLICHSCLLVLCMLQGSFSLGCSCVEGLLLGERLLHLLHAM